jgi:hypothetical protein
MAMLQGGLPINRGLSLGRDESSFLYSAQTGSGNYTASDPEGIEVYFPRG